MPQQGILAWFGVEELIDFVILIAMSGDWDVGLGVGGRKADRRTGRRTDGETDRRADGWKGGKTNRWMEERTDR